MANPISMVDILAEHQAYRKAKDNLLITDEMYQESKKLGRALAQLCLASQLEAYNQMVTKFQALRKAEAATQPVPIAEATVTPVPAAQIKENETHA